MKRLFACTLMLFATAPSLAADVNGYTAQYECRAGGLNCNVDVASLTRQSCQQTITTADSATTISSKINGGSQYICMQTGDYTDKGVITVTASGTSGARKVLRCVTPEGAACDTPWSTSTQAKLRKIGIDGADYWIIHGLTFPSNTSYYNDSDRISLYNGASDVIIDTNLLEGAPKDSGVAYYSAIGAWDCTNNTSGARTTIQNNVIRTNDGVPGSAGVGVSFECSGASDIRIVNNEMYDWSEHVIQIGNNHGPTIPGLVVENNDIYEDALATETEEPIAVKSSGTSGSPQRFIHNRIWGSRFGQNCCIGGGGSYAVVYSVGSNFSHHLWQNNIIFDSGGGIGYVSFGFAVTNQSIIGNIFYNLHPYSSEAAALGLEGSKTEVYLNTIIDSQYTINYAGSDTDVRCNVMIASGQNSQGGVPASYQADYNMFYGTPKFTYNGGNNNFEKDGSTALQAARGPYTFYRKLRTSPEPYTIPYARANTSATENGACPSSYASRSGIGINDIN